MKRLVFLLMIVNGEKYSMFKSFFMGLRSFYFC